MEFSKYYNKYEDEVIKEGIEAALSSFGEFMSKHGPDILGFSLLGNFILFGLVLLFYGNILTLGKIATIFRKGYDRAKEVKDIITGKDVDVKQISQNPGALKQRRALEKTQDKFGEDLSDVFNEIKQKDWDNAREEYKALSPQIRNNVEVQKIIIAEITKTLKEPPLYVKSPGNSTYQAIKKVINIKVAQASAAAVEKALFKVAGK